MQTEPISKITNEKKDGFFLVPKTVLLEEFLYLEKLIRTILGQLLCMTSTKA